MSKSDSTKQMKGKSDSELRKEITAEREKLWQLRTDLKAGKVKNVADIQKRRKAIARMLTELHMKKMDASVK